MINPLTPPSTYKPQQRQSWGNLHGSTLGLILSQVAQNTPFIVITPDLLSAQSLVDEIQFFAKTENLQFPDWETLPYDLFSPHQDIISERLATLYKLPTIERGVLCVPVNTLMQRLAPVDYVINNSKLLTIGDHFDSQLENLGYRSVEQVMEHGEFALRANRLDLFAMGCRQPCRIELFDDNSIKSIRYFDPESQRSQFDVDEILVLPAREFAFNDVSTFRSQWQAAGFGNSMMFKDVCSGITPAGIEYYLPLFFEQTQSFFDYLPENTVVITLDGVLEKAELFWQEVNQRYEQLDVEALAPSKLFLQANEVFAACKVFSHISITESSNHYNFTSKQPPELSVDAHSNKPLAALEKFLTEFEGRVLIAAETNGRRESLLNLFNKYQLKPTLVENWSEFLATDAAFCLTVAPLEKGLILSGIAVISETQLFGKRVYQRRRKSKNDTDAIIRNLTELTIGAPVVHEDHGVGRYQGLVTLNVSNIEAEFLQLEYANQDKLYVPISSLHLINRFTGIDPERAPLHRLGTDKWSKVKQKAAQKASDVAAELLEIYARRAAETGQSFKINQQDYQDFADSFAFDETADQQSAIDAVIKDMSSGKPMDRLVCGDVGFGKTEVAMRAAFVAVMDGKQVAILVPTTLLAQQHYQNFQDRFADLPVNIAQLSRFVSKKQQAETLEAISKGEVEIIIGTHKLLQKTVKYNNLGLIIIDEEHRFGVKQKEQFKSLRAQIDVLTMTATPIPRSLNMALSHIRDLSIISTPPTRRLAIKTFITQWHKPTLIEAISRELKRGGQIYFLHNEIETIEKMAKDVENLVPEAKVRIGHGKMRERELEQVMHEFYHRRFNILVCTTIIETGIDVPNANTIIINRADKLGLAQLYQLRGRVGRSHHRAYAYLIVPTRKLMTKDAQKRIDAISSIEELGMGFTLATHDLEIRGAGELLGSEQSGHMQEIGYTLYSELLERAINSLKSGEMVKTSISNTEINLHSSTILPNDYIPDVHTRLIMYKRIANAPTLQALDEIQIELIDRFGLLPEQTKALLIMTELKIKAMPLGISKIDFSASGGYIEFDQDTKVEPQKIVQLIQENPYKYKFGGENKLLLDMEIESFEERCELLDQLLEYL
jgi:transcription-repair coupling factor (superfamily II helicase)